MNLTEMVLHRIRVRTHRPTPQYLEMFRRYQCRECHSWIYYDEAIGSWWHNTEKNAPKYWDGAKWVLEESRIPYGFTKDEWQRFVDSYM